MPETRNGHSGKNDEHPPPRQIPARGSSVVMPATTQFPKLERFSLWCRWAIALITAIGGVAFAISIGNLAVHHESWIGIIWSAMFAFCCIFAGLWSIGKRILRRTVLCLSVFLWAIWIVALSPRKWIQDVHVNHWGLYLAAFLIVISVLLFFGYDISRWTDPRNRAKE